MLVVDLMKIDFRYITDAKRLKLSNNKTVKPRL